MASKHKGTVPPYARMKLCKVAGESDFECVPSKELWAKLDVLVSKDVLPAKRNAPDGLSDILQLSQFCAHEREFVQNDALEFEQEIRKKHKSMESEENGTMKVVNALPVDENENLTD